MRLREWYQRRPLHALLLDGVLVIVFALMGRSSHGGDLAPWHVLVTAGPFLIALGAGWLLLALIRSRASTGTGTGMPWYRPWPAGALLWLVTAGGGVLLRVTAFGQTAAGAFIIITFLVLAVLLLAPRALLGLGRDASASRPVR